MFWEKKLAAWVEEIRHATALPLRLELWNGRQFDFSDGVPQVAVVRLRALLEQRVPEEEKRDATLKLAEALIAAAQPSESLSILNEPVVRELPAANFLKGQALAALSRWRVQSSPPAP